MSKRAEIILWVFVIIGFLAVGLSHGAYENQAMAEPPALFNGPMHSTAFLGLFNSRQDINRRMVIVGPDKFIEETFSAYGWETLTVRRGDLRLLPKHWAHLVFYREPFPIDPRLLVELGRIIKVDWYLITPRGTIAILFKAFNFLKLPFNFEIQGNWYSIYQKTSRRFA